MEYKVVRLTYTASHYGVMVRYPSTGWIYIVKHVSKEDAEALLKELTCGNFGPS